MKEDLMQDVFDFAPKSKPKRIGNYRTTDHTGKRFGLLTVVERATEHYRGNQPLYHCRCDCGTATTVRSCSLVCGRVQSCGCLHKLATSRAHKTHGASQSRTYRIWRAVKNRCLNPNVPAYPWYGGRGITVCPEWRDSFAAFVNDMGAAPDKKSIDRIDPDAGYSKANCRWATVLEQGENKRNSRLITLNGVTHHIAEWSRITGIGRNVIDRRIKQGWEAGRILETPVRAIARWC